MGTAPGKLAVAPALVEVFLHGQKLPPGEEHTFGIRLKIPAAGHQVEIRHVRTVTVQENDLLEAVVGQRLEDIEHALDEMLVMAVHGAGKIHDVAAVAVPIRRQY